MLFDIPTRVHDTSADDGLDKMDLSDLFPELIDALGDDVLEPEPIIIKQQALCGSVGADESKTPAKKCVEYDQKMFSKPSKKRPLGETTNVTNVPPPGAPLKRCATSSSSESSVIEGCAACKSCGCGFAASFAESVFFGALSCKISPFPSLE